MSTLRFNIPRLCFLVLFATIIVAGIGGMTVVSMRQKIAQSAQRLQKNEAEVSRLERLSEELRAKIAMMEHPEVLRKLAVNFGMRPAELDQYRLVSEPADQRRQLQERSSSYAKGF